MTSETLVARLSDLIIEWSGRDVTLGEMADLRLRVQALVDNEETPQPRPWGHQVSSFPPAWAAAPGAAGGYTAYTVPWPAPEPAAKLTDEEREYARRQFSEDRACPHCGGLHLRACARVKRLVLAGGEHPKEVEFFEHPVWPEGSVVWPEDVFDAGEVPEGEDDMPEKPE